MHPLASIFGTPERHKVEGVYPLFPNCGYEKLTPSALSAPSHNARLEFYA
jgi:hypothetical protein